METRIYKKYPHSLYLPEMVNIQVEAYKKFLQEDVSPTKRKNIGLEAIFRETFPVKSYDNTITLDYLWYEVGLPRYTPDECKALKITYGAPLKARLRLNKPESVEEYVYLGDVPMMIGGGEFIINGVERIVVSQLHRSPGVDFKLEKVGDRISYVATIIPERGSWIEITIAKKNSFAIKVDQGGKIPATTFLRAMDESFSTDTQIIKAFYETEIFPIDKNTSIQNLTTKYAVVNVVDPETNKVIIEAGHKITEESAKALIESEMTKEIEVIKFAVETAGNEPYELLMLNTLNDDTTRSHQEALLKIYARLRPGMPAQEDKAKTVFYERFLDKTRYQLGRVGRFRINRKFNLSVPETEQTLLKDDIVEVLRYLIKLRKGEGIIDDIDHLGSRRVRPIDELLSDEMRKGFYKLQKSVRDRLNSFSAPTFRNEQQGRKTEPESEASKAAAAKQQDKRINYREEATPRTLINSKTISAVVNHFFERGELSQVADQTNPLSQLTHERRLSALGPGGLNRKRAGFEVRDVHPSHYGRICPVETPEGANIGLITSLASYSQVDKYGFLTTPFRVVKNGIVTDEIVQLRADEEANVIIASADLPVKGNKILEGKIIARHNGEFKMVTPTEINYQDVSPFQVVGISAGLVPFLEHDDANRALMGANMERQGVPLLKTEAPLVVTGLEKVVAENSAMVIKAKRAGVVSRVDANQIIIGYETESGDEEFDTYNLTKYEGLNEKTCMNQKPIVKIGDKIKASQIIADGPGTFNGELSLGKNILIAFMPWEGYNFEDAIIVSEKLLKEDSFTSIHIEDFEVEIRETKFGKEEFTRDIPNVSERVLRNLDESGIIRVGTRVKPGDILVGKIAPKSKSELTPEEKLLHAIFGKAGEDVKNVSLDVPAGVDGIIIETQHFARRANLSEKQKEELTKTTKKVERDINTQIQTIIEAGIKPLEKIVGKRLVPRPIAYGPRGTIKSLNELKEKLSEADKLEFSSRSDKELVLSKIKILLEKCEKLENEKDVRVNRIIRGDDLRTGVLEMVRVKIATKRNLSVGDKIAGRHGNKGVIARILPEEDMPHLEDGTPIEIILNPLGVPSRMNVGQIFETHLGWAANKLGFRAISPIFDGATEQEITEALKEANLPADGKVTLYDGRTGDAFKEKITVGYAYIMKLHHLVDDKIHARATGPYSLITQQPLGGKARYGGQRLGEMEVWALEAYGAANVLQEMLTVKSDDVDGRARIYEAIIKGENTLVPTTPVSFEVLLNEIKGLGLSLKLEKDKEKPVAK
ncbi:MAG: DNA-directed RNA polymerase subunit beta [Candidatus Brocadiia bacterium]